jgi:drug/metabolite transporter (DMT)-like permease
VQTSGTAVLIQSRIVSGVALTTLAMLAFAGNSILSRMALQDGAIDAASFSNIRLLSGALALLLILATKSGTGNLKHRGSWLSALMLFLYALSFSYAYLDLSAGTGALILFGLVQATMIIAAVIAGDKPTRIEILGWLCASAGLIYLVLPGIAAPSAGGTILMAIAGIAWGFYSIRGRNEPDPLAATASNFLRSVVFIPFVVAATYQSIEVTTNGILLAVAAGAITSGVGYVIWYAALRFMHTIQAALVQLSVPAIAALGGVILLDEVLSMRLVLSAAMVLGGLSIALGRKSSNQTRPA